MPNHTSFRLNRSGMLLALISAAFASEAAAATGGRVDFATTGATIAGNDGRQRPLVKGAELGTGDTVRTDAAARAQIRFSDGSYVSLQPNTEFSIKEYNFEGKTDGSERGFFGLAKGAMRTVTGLVGRINRNRYQISTPTATVGIRGTGGRIEVLLDGSTLVAGTSGIWTLSNSAGTIDVPAGTAGKAPANPDQPPQQSTEQPKTDPAPPPPPFRKGDAAPVPTTLPPLVSGSGFAVGAAFTSSVNESTVATVSLDSVATFDDSGQFTGYTSAGFSAKLAPETRTAAPTSAGLAVESNNRDGLAWGRWTGSVENCSGTFCSTDFYSDNKGFHYVIGTPTAVMPTQGKASYTMMGATSPTYVDGRVTPGTFSGTVDATFTPTGTIVGMNLNVSMPDNKGYAITGSTAPMSGAVFSGVASATLSGPGTYTQSGQLSILPTTAGSCGCNCSADVKGFFAGATAERAGIAYRIQDGGPGNQVVGAAAFKKVQ